MSQPNVITISVDTLNDGTAIVDEVYTRYDDYPTRSIYIGANHSVSAQDTLTFYRTEPRKSGNFNGAAKVSYKFTRTHVVDGVDGISQLIVPFIKEVKYSIPVGISQADCLLGRQSVIALTDLDAIMTPLFMQQMI